MLYVFCLLHLPAARPSLSLSSDLPIAWDTIILKGGQLITTMAYKCSSERKNNMSFTFFFNSERVRRSRERGRERERERESQAGSALSSQSPVWGSNSQTHDIMTWAEIKSQTFNRLSHPGAPMSFTWNQKLEMIMFSEEQLLKAETDQRLGLLYQLTKLQMQRKSSWRKLKVLLQWTC